MARVTLLPGRDIAFDSDPSGSGTGAGGVELTPTRVLVTPQVTHIRYAVRGRAPLVLDDRGRGGGPTVTAN